ncbi:hypothetical protein Back2_25040 [Nocardioides baekrokdamisoli]|uniref:Signal peptidase I n=1 Tax=Nocardioides baekrokdamisoli TaxID=1804624 RepID=A0A3G9IGT2_9ACTN|nr:signal peptidase I [Nocardioides baekrokdamisoli]BBH18217.1 hypothetical protein Back2_25040 [Nocardioides baekrokdamisoli]
MSFRRRLSARQEILLVVAAAVVVFALVQTFFAQQFYVPSGSMEPTLHVNDRILVDKTSTWSGSPIRGDVVVFSDPGGWDDRAANPGGINGVLSAIGLYPSDNHIVKRVIGIAGDTITCCNPQGQLSVNGHALDEHTYAVPGVWDGKTCYGPMIPNCRWSAGPVPPGYLFVMGDNRAHSADSTVHLCTAAETDCHDVPWVPVDNVVGRVFAIIWPVGRWTWLSRPAAFGEIS